MPTVAGFIVFIQNVMGISANYLPTTSPAITAAFKASKAVVNPAFCEICPSIYAEAVYNLAADNLLNWAQDQTASISGITWASGTATATTAAAHGFLTGDILLIARNAPLAYNSQPGPANTVLGTSVVVTGTNTFTYTIPVNPGAFSQGGTASEIYFSSARVKFNLTGFVAGVISSSSDVSTSESILNPDFMTGLTMGNLQNLKTPYGRAYLAIAQDYGTLWGVS